MTRRSKTPPPHSRRTRNRQDHSRNALLSRRRPRRRELSVGAAVSPGGLDRGDTVATGENAAAALRVQKHHPSAEGRMQVKVAPAPVFAEAERRPPCASMMERPIRSPIPILFGLVE
jgi:hypothetical protein